MLLFSRFERPERQQVLELGVNEQTFRLGCTPAINLFKQTAEPIQMTQARIAYTVVPDARQSEVMEIYSIDEVAATNPKMRETTMLEPIHAYRYQTREEKEMVFWSATRKVNELGERRPSTVKISVVDLNGQADGSGGGCADGALHLHQLRPAVAADIRGCGGRLRRDRVRGWRSR